MHVCIWRVEAGHAKLQGDVLLVEPLYLLT